MRETAKGRCDLIAAALPFFRILWKPGNSNEAARKSGKRVFERNLLLHVARAALGGLMARGVAAGSPEDATEKDNHDDGYDNEWGSDVHGSTPSSVDYQNGPVRGCPQFYQLNGGGL